MILGSGSMVFGDGRGEKLIQPSSIRWIHEVLIDPPPGSRGERLGVQWPLDAHWTFPFLWKYWMDLHWTTGRTVLKKN
jgi:hypothetical protein